MHDFKAFYINVLQVVPHVSRLPFLPIRVRGIFSYLLAMKWIVSISMYHQLSNSGMRVHMPRKNTDSVQVSPRWFTPGIVVPSSPHWGIYTLGLMLNCLPPLIVNAGFIMNHF